MNWFDYLLLYLSSSLIVYFVIKACGNIFDIKNKNNRLFALIVFIGGIVITYSLFNNGTYENILVSVICLSIGGIILYNQNLNVTIFNVMICYLFVVIYEILTIGIIGLIIKNLEVFMSNSIIKSVFSLVVVFLAYLTCSNKHIKAIINKITNKSTLINFILIVVIISLVLLDAKYILFDAKNVYIGNVLILSCLLFMFIFSLFKDQKLTKENEKTEMLLLFLTKYEKIIDDNRIYRHELLNNLLMLKSYKDKNTKEFNKLLDELIYSKSDKNISIKNIYNLPQGLKGIFYYKLYNLSDDNYKISLNVSRKVGDILNRIPHNDYIDLHKIIGIILDNAIEACKSLKNKQIIIDIYQEDTNICFEVSNSYKGNINLEDLNKKGYSTKGNNRGYGLYLVKKIIEKNSNIKIEQLLNNKLFTTIIKVSI